MDKSAGQSAEQTAMNRYDRQRTRDKRGMALFGFEGLRWRSAGSHRQIGGQAHCCSSLPNAYASDREIRSEERR